MQPSPMCTQASELRERAAESRKIYIAAVHGLDTVLASDEQAANDRVEHARVLYLKARTALQAHEAEHGCGFNPDSH